MPVEFHDRSAESLATRVCSCPGGSVSISVAVRVQISSTSARGFEFFTCLT